MSDRVLAGVMPVTFYDPTNMSPICLVNALTDEGLNTTVENDEVRGGDAHHLISKYFYNSNLQLKLTNALFSLEYLALKTGATIEMGSNVQYSETITTTVANQITVTKTPVAFPGTNKIVGSYKLSSASNSAWTTITFNNSVASISNLPIGSTVCVRYFYADSSARQFKIPSNIIPSIVYAVAEIPEFSAGTEDGVFTAKSKVGVLQVVIPQLLFDPNAELSVTSSGHATMDLTGDALINQSGDCSGSGYYAILSETTEGGDAFTGAKSIVIANSNIDLATAGTSTLQVYAMYNGITVPKLLDNSLLTFTSSTAATATVGSHTGIVTAVANGTTTIEAVVTAHTGLSATALVTVA